MWRTEAGGWRTEVLKQYGAKGGMMRRSSEAGLRKGGESEGVIVSQTYHHTSNLETHQLDLIPT